MKKNLSNFLKKLAYIIIDINTFTINIIHTRLNQRINSLYNDSDLKKLLEFNKVDNTEKLIQLKVDQIISNLLNIICEDLARIGFTNDLLGNSIKNAINDQYNNSTKYFSIDKTPQGRIKIKFNDARIISNIINRYINIVIEENKIDIDNALDLFKKDKYDQEILKALTEYLKQKIETILSSRDINTKKIKEYVSEVEENLKELINSYIEKIIPSEKEVEE